MMAILPNKNQAVDQFESFELIDFLAHFCPSIYENLLKNELKLV